MKAEFCSIAGVGEAGWVQKRSRFIGYATPIRDIEEAKACIQLQKRRYFDAKHHVFAYILESGEERFSDDGEPQGTGGAPILEVLKGKDLRAVCVVVTRYFGGVLLGTGGLVRAYSKACKLALEQTEMVTYQLCQRCELVVAYSEYQKLFALFSRYHLSPIAPSFSEMVTLEVLVPLQHLKGFTSALTEFTGGQCNCRIREQEYAPCATEQK